MKLYRYIPVWQRALDGVTLYRCFEILGEGFTVQSKDFFSVDTIKEDLSTLEVQFLELLLEEAPETRFRPQQTLEEAIESFNGFFGD